MSWRSFLHAACFVQVPIEEIPFKQRPRFTKNGRAYTPAKTLKFERQIQAAWQIKYGDCYAEFEGPVEIIIETSRPLCKSHPKRWLGKQDLTKPDVDNIGKVVCDALNGLAYKDDKQITELIVRKKPLTEFGTNPRMNLNVYYYVNEFERNR